jgi:hypothetical protein
MLAKLPPSLAKFDSSFEKIERNIVVAVVISMTAGDRTSMGLDKGEYIKLLFQVEFRFEWPYEV